MYFFKVCRSLKVIKSTQHEKIRFQSKPTVKKIDDKVILNPACLATETSWSSEILHGASLANVHFQKVNSKDADPLSGLHLSCFHGDFLNPNLRVNFKNKQNFPKLRITFLIS